MLPNYHILNILPVPYDSTHDYRIKIKSERFKHSILIDLNISESNSLDTAIVYLKNPDSLPWGVNNLILSTFQYRKMNKKTAERIRKATNKVIASFHVRHPNTLYTIYITYWEDRDFYILLSSTIFEGSGQKNQEIEQNVKIISVIWKNEKINYSIESKKIKNNKFIH